MGEAEFSEFLNVMFQARAQKIFRERPRYAKPRVSPLLFFDVDIAKNYQRSPIGRILLEKMESGKSAPGIFAPGKRAPDYVPLEKVPLGFFAPGIWAPK